MTYYLAAASLIAGLAFSLGSLLLALLYLRRLKLPVTAAPITATIILPLTGQAPGLKALVDALFQQTHPARRLLITVESDLDPAYERARNLSQGHPLPIEVIVAEPQNTAAQKCTNLIAAVKCIDERDDVVVFIDADILPPSWWLSAVASPLTRGIADIVTGYRWTTVTRPGIGAHLLAAIDHSIALLPRIRFAHVVWGGTLGMRRATLDRLNLPVLLSHSISDDLAIAHECAKNGLRVLTRRALLVPSPSDHKLLEAWRFGRRQYQMITLSQPLLWLLATATTSIQLSAWATLAYGLPSPVFAMAAGGMMVSLNAMQQVCILRIEETISMNISISAKTIQLALAIAKPLVHVFHLSMLLPGFWTRSITWGHIRYSVHGLFNVKVMKRNTWKT